MTEFHPFMIGLFENSWRAAMLILAIFALRYMLGKKIPPGWRFGIWLLVAVPLIFRISFPASWSIFNLVPSGSELLGMTAAIDGGSQIRSADFVNNTGSMPRFFRFIGKVGTFP